MDGVWIFWEGVDLIETYRNYELQRTILPVSTPLRVWKYEIRNTVTDKKFTFWVHIKDSLELNVRPIEDLQKDIERKIKWYLNQETEGDRKLIFQPENESVRFVGDETCK